MGDIGYNNPKVTTPNLDKLAAEGATLTDHYVMPQCTPTRLALFTGRYPGRFGISGQQASVSVHVFGALRNPFRVDRHTGDLIPG